MGLFDKKFCDICGEKVNMLTQKSFPTVSFAPTVSTSQARSQAAGSREPFRTLKITLNKESRTSRSISSLTALQQRTEDTVRFKSISITAGLSLLLITEILKAAILRCLSFLSFRISGSNRNTERLTIRTTTVSPTTGIILTTDSLTILTASAEILTE